MGINLCKGDPEGSYSIQRYGCAGELITIKPDVPERFCGWKVTDANGDVYDLDITDHGDGTYSFIMPDEEINISTISPITMVDGASIRLNNPTGLGFITNIDYDFYNNLIDKYGKDNVKTGTIIIPTKYAREVIDSGNSLTFDGFSITGKVVGKDYIDVENDGFKNCRLKVTDIILSVAHL